MPVTSTSFQTMTMTMTILILTVLLIPPIVKTNEPPIVTRTMTIIAVYPTIVIVTRIVTRD
jgi:hypothetical protein